MISNLSQSDRDMYVRIKRDSLMSSVKMSHIIDYSLPFSE